VTAPPRTPAFPRPEPPSGSSRGVSVGRVADRRPSARPAAGDRPQSTTPAPHSTGWTAA